jgi:hypothetical protein
MIRYKFSTINSIKKLYEVQNKVFKLNKTDVLLPLVYEPSRMKIL